MKIYYLLFLCAIFSCNTSRKKVTTSSTFNKILVVFKHPKEIDESILFLQNSSLSLEQLVVNKDNLKIGVIKIPRKETAYWIKTLNDRPEFKKATIYSKENLQQLITNEKNIFLTYKKQSCRGFCPVFEATIYKNGKVSFVGKSNVKVIGLKEIQLNSAEFTSLKKYLNHTPFESFQSIYDNKYIADLPTTIIDINNKQITIRDTQKTPEQLLKVIELLDNILKTKKLYE